MKQDSGDESWQTGQGRDESEMPLKENYVQQFQPSPTEAFFAVEQISTKDWPQKKKNFCERRTLFEKLLLLLCLILTAGCIGLAIRLLCEHIHSGGLQFSNLRAENSSHEVCMTESCIKTAASLLRSMDASVDPCTDFYQFACGSWDKTHIIPEDRTSIGTFEVLDDSLQIILKGLLEEPVSPADSEAIEKAKMFYMSCMDTSQLKLLGDAPLLATIELLGGWPVLSPNWTRPDVSIEKLLGRIKREINLGAIFELTVEVDDSNSEVNVIQIDQPQLGLDSRDYYLKPNSVKDLTAYHRYMTEVAVLLGADKKFAAEEMKKVVAFELQVANMTIPLADRFDPALVYKKLTLTELETLIPEFSWRTLLESLIFPLMDDERIVIYAQPYMKEVAKLLTTTDERIIWNYILWRTVMDLVPFQHEGFLEKQKDFQKVLIGVENDRSRWMRCVEYTNKRFSLAVGAMFVERHFDQESKDTALEMINDIRAAFVEGVGKISWMDEETRIVARDKIEAMKEHIGYPELIKDPSALIKEYSKVTVSKGAFLENILNLKATEIQKTLDKLRKPADRHKWISELAIVNAFYNPNGNDIVFPAGILQPFFYSRDFPKSLNYGAIGVVIGHEMTHAFDDRGRQFDKQGNLKQWWSNETIEAFRKEVQCLINQYSGYEIKEIGMNLDGRLTQGENVADNGGLKLGFKAYKNWTARNEKEPLLPGIALNHDQLFFLNYAQIWCGRTRAEAAVSKSRTSAHSPGYIRVVGPLSNSEDYAKVYNCKPGSPMNPVKKCNVY